MTTLKEKEIEKKKKEEKPKEIPKKKHYTVSVDAIVPIQAKYSVWAFNEKEAAELIKKGLGSLQSMSKPPIVMKYMTEIAVYIGGTINKIFSIKLR